MWGISSLELILRYLSRVISCSADGSFSGLCCLKVWGNWRKFLGKWFTPPHCPPSPHCPDAYVANALSWLLAWPLSASSNFVYAFMILSAFQRARKTLFPNTEKNIHSRKNGKPWRRKKRTLLHEDNWEEKKTIMSEGEERNRLWVVYLMVCETIFVRLPFFRYV